MKRFYRKAEVAERSGGFTVALDGRPARTPAKAALVVPTRGLAEAVAAEWRAQGDHIQPHTMGLMRLTCTAIDRVARHRDDVIDEIAAYGGTDLVCYHATHPRALADRQEAAWRPLLDWVARHYHAPLVVTVDLMPVGQPAAALRALRHAIAEMDDMTLAALHGATGACGSLVIALALAAGRIDAEEAWEMSLLDESYQIECWGEDDEAARRRESLREDIATAARFMELCRR